MGRNETAALAAGASAARGVTLIELLATVAVLGILLALGIPALDAALVEEKLSSHANSFLASLHLARSEAIKRGSRVVVCKSADGTACATTGSWDQGWLVFHDADNDAQRDAGEAVIQRMEPLPAGFVLTGNLWVANYVSYAPSGATRLIGGAFQAGTFTICRAPESHGQARQIIINSTGRPRVSRPGIPPCP